MQNINDYLLTCPSKHFMGMDCLGCGLQRSLVALFEGRLYDSLTLYPATIPMIFCFVLMLLHLKFDFKRGTSIIKGMFIFTAIIVISFYIYKIITHQIF
jgi:hypothetical protein